MRCAGPWVPSLGECTVLSTSSFLSCARHTCPHLSGSQRHEVPEGVQATAVTQPGTRSVSPELDAWGCWVLSGSAPGRMNRCMVPPPQTAHLDHPPAQHLLPPLTQGYQRPGDSGSIFPLGKRRCAGQKEEASPHVGLACSLTAAARAVPGKPHPGAFTSTPTRRPVCPSPQAPRSLSDRQSRKLRHDFSSSPAPPTQGHVCAGLSAKGGSTLVTLEDSRRVQSIRRAPCSRQTM